ncbi:MAG: sulfatase-like hydrolase/transferase [Aurantibacter sp.]
MNKTKVVRPIVFNIFLFCFLCTGCKPSAENPSKPQKPNIVLIMVDDLGKEWVGAYGTDSIATPNIDALAETGIRFKNAYAMPQCTPTRLTLLTGQYPFRHGWVNHWDVPRWGGGAHFDDELYPSLGRSMKKAGYETCISGKWQIDDFRVEPDALTKSGFDSYCMWTGYEEGVPASAERYQNPYVYQDGKSRTRAGEFGPDVFANYVRDFIEANREKPFFVYYPMVLTHTPLVNTPDETGETDLDKHKAMVRYMDQLTGEITAAIDDAKIRENTIIIWTTDNGSTRKITGHINGQPIKGAKMLTNEAGTAVPFIVNWKGQNHKKIVSDALIDFSDLLPTLVDLAGSSIDSSKKVDGLSFKKILLDPTQDSNREWILSMGGGNHAKLTDQGVENQYIFRDRVLRNKKYKLYVDYRRQPEKFFDMIEDPYEQSNLIDEINTREQKEHFEKLVAVIETFPKADNDPQYRPNPPQKWDVEITAESQNWKIE